MSDENSIKRSSTADLKHDHLTVRRVGAIAQRCSDKLYAGGDDEDIPIEDIEILSVVIEEFIDAFHHGKEEKAYFPVTKSKDGYSEDIRKFLIEHELGRRIANMLRREIQLLKKSSSYSNLTAANTNSIQEQDRTEMERRKKEPIARFLKSYVVFIDDHTGKEDIFFDLIEHKQSISNDEDRALLQHYEACKNEVGGQVRI
ncbi:MAG TPA: hemerythrin domain-containing protein [Nitrososphaeraceae archaeon]|nr:hemerythrin domain-containing protein [Nitrososphaeraceae archaeon]